MHSHLVLILTCSKSKFKDGMFALEHVCQTSKASLVESESFIFNSFPSSLKTQLSVKTRFFIFSPQLLHTTECRAPKLLGKTSSAENPSHSMLERVEVELTYYSTILFPTIFVLKYLDLVICPNSTNNTI